MQNGKGSSPRNCFSKQFKSNYDKINWQNKEEIKTYKQICSETKELVDNIWKSNHPKDKKIKAKVRKIITEWRNNNY